MKYIVFVVIAELKLIYILGIYVPSASAQMPRIVGKYEVFYTIQRLPKPEKTYLAFSTLDSSCGLPDALNTATGQPTEKVEALTSL